MAKNFKDIMATFSEERQKAIHEASRLIVAEEMSLQELRNAHDFSQKVLSKNLQINQATVSKIERQADMLVSTLRSFIEAMGGELEIIATFPNYPPVKINQFSDIAATETDDTDSSYDEESEKIELLV